MLYVKLWIGYELKSMRSAGKPFHAFMILSAKKFDLTEVFKEFVRMTSCATRT